MHKAAAVDVAPLLYLHGVSEPSPDNIGKSHLGHFRPAGETHFNADALFAARYATGDGSRLNRVGLFQAQAVLRIELRDLARLAGSVVQPLGQFMNTHVRSSFSPSGANTTRTLPKP